MDPISGPHDLFYLPEFLDVVGPMMLSLTVLETSTGVTHGPRLAWSAQDPTPGSGVAYYAVQVRDNNGPWQIVVPATRSVGLEYTRVQVGHRYTFRVRARDRVNNWGAWAIISVQVS